MLQKVGDRIANCLARAADAEQRAAEATNETMRSDNEGMAKAWRHLASSYQFVDSLDRFLLEANKRKGRRPFDKFDLAPFEPFEPDTPPARDLRRAVDTISSRNLLCTLAAVCHDKALEVGICEPLLGLEWLQLATGLEAFARARGDLR